MGAMGTGKTLASVALSYQMLRDYRVLSASFNFPVSFASSVGYKHQVGTMDEGGVFFDNRLAYKDKALTQRLAELTAFLRKRGSYFIVPSYIAVDKRLRNGMRLYRTHNVGNLLWVYHWEQGEENSEEQRKGLNYWEGTLALYNPRFFFNTYDTYYAPSSHSTMEYALKFVTPQLD